MTAAPGVAQATPFANLNVMQPHPTLAGQGLFVWARQPLANICQPSTLLVRVLSAEFLVDGFITLLPSYDTPEQWALDPDEVFSGERTGIPLEGPFLEYTVAAGEISDDPLPFQTLGAGNGRDACLKFYFDLAQPRPLNLPFRGSVAIVGQYPGRWLVQWALLTAARQASPRGNSPGNNAGRHTFDSESTLSLVLRQGAGGAVTQKSRVFRGLPMGGTSLTVQDSAPGPTYPVISVWEEDAPKRGVPGPGGNAIFTHLPLYDFWAQSSGFYNRVGLGNARRIEVAGIADADANGVGLVQFHVVLGG